MKKLIENFFSPTPSNIKRWQKISLGCGAAVTAIVAGGAMYGFIPMWIVQALAVLALGAPFLMQFRTVKPDLPDEVRKD